VRCGPVKRSRRGPWRAASLILVHLLVLVHLAHWKITGRTLTPLEPSESMQTLELGYVNAGFILFGLLLVATLVVGRFFCGWACHVVAYQDLCAWLLRKIGLKPKPVRSRLLAWVPLGAALYMFVWPQIVRWLDRTGQPGLGWHLTTTRFWDTFPGPLVAALTLLVDGFLIVYLLGAKGFCTYGCPYGGLFGVADRVAMGKIRVTDACEGCGHCTDVCTSNVRVHEEVRTHRMVVDPGCMKCLDCVNVCPKDALYFGFGAPTLLAPAPRQKVRKSYDFSWPEEAAMALSFLVALYAFRGLYGQVPFLFAIGLAVTATIAVMLVWRLARQRDLAFQHLRLRSAGRLSRAGAAALALALAMLAFTGDSLFVQYHGREGERLLLEAERLPHGDRAGVLEASLAHLQQADRAGLFGDGTLELKIGSILREQGHRDEAEQRMRRAIDLAPGLLSPRLALADLLMMRGEAEQAKSTLEALLAIDPQNAPARQRLDALETRARAPRR
jgi:ferredoxin